mmetsp:Transcript_17802/g.42861  ORF Transcript_17802/g.42861 Transcript_17802/m.42861 type:complete len:301 (+) Transcript_17802:108-1010(+)
MILYAVVARAKDGAILVESMIAGVEGNFPQITVEVLERIVSSGNWTSALGTLESSSREELLPDGARRTFVQRHDAPMFCGLSGMAAQTWSCFGYNANDVESSAAGGGYTNNGDMDYYFHLCRKDNVICLCISDDTDVRYHVVNYEFLSDVEGKFTKSYAPYKITKAKAYEMDKKFGRELGKLIYFYNENRNKMVRQDRVDDLLNKVDDLKGVLGKNITMVLERETRLADLVVKSEDMLEDTKVFSRRSSRLKTKVRREYYSYHIIAFVFGVLVLYLFACSVCGYSFERCSSDGGGGEGGG